jgi:hypothetical protein
MPSPPSSWHFPIHRTEIAPDQKCSAAYVKVIGAAHARACIAHSAPAHGVRGGRQLTGFSVGDHGRAGECFRVGIEEQAAPLPAVGAEFVTHQDQLQATRAEGPERPQRSLASQPTHCAGKLTW